MGWLPLAVLTIESDGCIGGALIPQLQPPTTTAHTLAPNDVSSARWQHPYLGYFCFIFVQWEEAETHRPSLYSLQSMVWSINTNNFIHFSYFYHIFLLKKDTTLQSLTVYLLSLVMVAKLWLDNCCSGVGFSEQLLSSSDITPSRLPGAKYCTSIVALYATVVSCLNKAIMNTEKHVFHVWNGLI